MKRTAWASLAACVGALFLVLSTSSCGDYPIVPKAGKAGSGPVGTAGSGTGGGTGIPSGPAPLPCKVLGDAGNECVSAHSTVRVIVPNYTGPLYQVDNGTTTQDIGSVGGYADAAAQDAFCPDGCTISVIYDQSGRGNHLTKAPPGSAKATPSNNADAGDLPVKINGHDAYGILFKPNHGYRAACNECPFPKPFPSGVPVGDEPQTVYMISSQHDLAPGCCFDYGNAEVTANNDGNGTMEAVYVGMGVIWGSGVGPGPWVMADLENGLFPGWENNSFNNISTATSVTFDFVTGVVVGDTADKNGGKGRFAVYGGDATVPTITEMYDGIRPEKPGYVPMKKQGSVILAIGGDNSDGDGGRFYEGAIALKAATKEVVAALQVAIAQAGYGK
jgi:non-reducing end alpha-L-arabinofuranosidase